MIHFDSHTDLYDGYFGGYQAHPRHAVPPGRRGGPARSEAHRADRHPRLDLRRRGSRRSPPRAGVRIVTIEELMDRGPEAVMAEARAIVGGKPGLRLVRHRRHRPVAGARHRHAGDRRLHDAHGAADGAARSTGSTSSAPISSRSRRPSTSAASRPTSARRSCSSSSASRPTPSPGARARAGRQRAPRP